MKNYSTLGKNKFFLFVSQNIHLLILGVATLLSSFALAIIMSFDTSRLNVFGPTAKVYFYGIKNGLISSTAILIVSMFLYLVFKKKFADIGNYLTSCFYSLSNFRKNLLILLICFIFAFTTHSGGILNGYFNMDDFEVTALNHTLPFGESLLIPHGNDHTIPLFKAEMRILGNTFGQNPLPYNLFFFSLFALIPFFTYLIFKRFGLGVLSFFVFLVVFTGATNWADMLTGFNIMNVYPQTILFFSIAILSFLRWHETKNTIYVLAFAISTIFALTVDISGIWVLPAIFLFIFYHHWQKSEMLKITKSEIKNFFKENIFPLSTLLLVVILFAIFLFVTFNILQPNSFLTTLNGDDTSLIDEKATYWKPDLFVSNFFSLFSFGVSLPILFPNIDKLLAHPSLIDNVKLIWPTLKWVIAILNVSLLWFVFRRVSAREKKLTVLLLSIIFVAISMVIVARPDHELVPNFDYRYAGTAFYAYSIFLSLSAALFLKVKKEYALKILIPTAIVIISLNQALGFQASRLEEEAKLRKEATVRVDNTLLQELDDLSKNSGNLTIPNLSGASIFEGMQGYTLADYVLFFNRKTPINLIRNEEMQPDVKTHTVKTVDSVRANTSQEFKETMKNPGAIRSYYLFPTLMRYKNVVEPEKTNTTTKQDVDGQIIIEKNSFDPEKKNTVGLSFYTENIPGNLELFFTFNNDFNVTEKTGRIRIDDYTPHTLKDGYRLYSIETNLLQLYAFSLSERVSNLTLHVAPTKNTFVDNIYFR